MFDWTVNLGNLISIVSMFVIGIGFLYTMKNRIDSMANRLIVLEEDLKKLIDVLIQQGRQEERIDALDKRMIAQGIRLDSLTDRFNKQVDTK